MKRSNPISLNWKLLLSLLVSIFIAGCGGGNSEPDPQNQLETNQQSLLTGVKFAIKRPIVFNSAFCVSIHVSGSDFATIVSESVYPPSTEIIETVVPNIPVGTDRTVEMGIFESGKCGAPVDAEWYANTSGVEIVNSEVTIVNLD